MARLGWAVWGEENVRQVELYSSMRWGELDGGLSSYLVAAAPFGGPIALTRDTSKIGFRTMNSDSDDITVYSSSGEYIKSIPRFEDGGRLLHLGWSLRENLYCVYEGGQVKVCVRGGSDLCRQKKCEGREAPEPQVPSGTVLPSSLGPIFGAGVRGVASTLGGLQLPAATQLQILIPHPNAFLPPPPLRAPHTPGSPCWASPARPPLTCLRASLASAL
jgi:hypothetical protein